MGKDFHSHYSSGADPSPALQIVKGQGRKGGAARDDMGDLKILERHGAKRHNKRGAVNAPFLYSETAADYGASISSSLPSFLRCSTLTLP